MAAFLARLYTSATGQPCSGEHPFSDVPDGTYYADAVGCIYELGVTTGTTPTTYDPQSQVSRAQMAAFLARLYPGLETPRIKDLRMSSLPVLPPRCLWEALNLLRM